MKSDRLADMFAMQEAFMHRLRQTQPGFPQDWPLDLSVKENQIEIRDLAFNSMGELFEVIQELKNSKKHRKTDDKEFNRDKFCEECVDAYKFFLEILIFAGISADEFFEMYKKKDAVINARIDEGY